MTEVKDLTLVTRIDFTHKQPNLWGTADECVIPGGRRVYSGLMDSWRIQDFYF